MPQFGDFELEPLPFNDQTLRLDWTEKSSGYLFGPHQISDGSLRFMALTTLLLQPEDNLPNVIILDEPELGLHPAAIVELAGMIHTASRNTQIIVSTQSTRLVDEFTAEDVVVVERDENKRCTIFNRLDKKALEEWLERYSLSELWEKNVLGGRP
jgi:predicted ATPase